jgi:hypothetical protein
VPHRSIPSCLRVIHSIEWLSNPQLLGPLFAEDRENGADAYWDAFYSNHAHRFFKDRHWLPIEFPELFPCWEDSPLVSFSHSQSHPEAEPQQDQQPGHGISKVVRIFEIGCGVGNTLIPVHLGNQAESELESSASEPTPSPAQEPENAGTGTKAIASQTRRRRDDVGIELYGCECSKEALKVFSVRFSQRLLLGLRVNFVESALTLTKLGSSLFPSLQDHPAFPSSRITLFPWDPSQSPTPPITLPSMDICLLIFVLSAVPPHRQQDFLEAVGRTMKPGAVLMVRDYARFDMTQLRFKRKLSENLYSRGDGTLVYFFDEGKERKKNNEIEEKGYADFITRRVVIWPLLPVRYQLKCMLCLPGQVSPSEAQRLTEDFWSTGCAR